MRNPISDTQSFYLKHFRDLPTLTRERLLWRLAFISEEWAETQDAIIHNDAENTVDGLIDMLVVILGTLYEAEVDLNQAWTVVHEANMEKERGSQVSRPGSAGADLVKPEGWIKPSHEDNHGVLDTILKIT